MILPNSAKRDQVVKLTSRYPRNHVRGAGLEVHVQVLCRTNCLVRLKEGNQADHQLSLRSCGIDLVVVFAIELVVLGDSPRQDTQVGHDSLQIIEKTRAVQAYGPLWGCCRGDIGVERQPLQECHDHWPWRAQD